MKRRNRTLERLEKPFETLARTYAERWDVKITPSGTRLCTDGKTISFPWSMSEIKKTPFNVLNGHLDHEVGHIREERRHKLAGRRTPLEFMADFSEKNQNTMKLLLNAFEDIRMEIQYSKEYLGISENLRAANIHSVEEIQKREDTCFWRSFGCCLIFEAFGMKGDFFDDKYVPYLELCKEEIEASKTISWAEESADLAHRVFAKISEYAEGVSEEAKKKREKKGEDDSSGEKKLEDEDGPAPVDDAPEEELSDDEETAEAALKESEDTHLMDAGLDAIEEEAEEILRKERPYTPWPEALKRDKWAYAPMGDKSKYHKLKDEVAQQTKALRVKLFRRTKAMTKSREIYGSEFGRLDTTSLARLRVGESKIFGITVKGIKISTAILILIDQSGSMGHADEKWFRAFHARLAAIGLAESIDALGIPFEVIGFDNDSEVGMDWNDGKDGYIHRTPFRFDVYKAFHEKFRNVRYRMVNITGKLDNADGEAIYLCAKRLAARPEQRKMMFVMSDGSPMCLGVTPHEGEKYLKKIVKTVTDSGIELFGFGIQTNDVKKFYNKETGSDWVNIDKIENLSRETFQIMGKKLISFGKE